MLRLKPGTATERQVFSGGPLTQAEVIKFLERVHLRFGWPMSQGAWLEGGIKVSTSHSLQGLKGSFQGGPEIRRLLVAATWKIIQLARVLLTLSLGYLFFDCA